MNTKYNKYVCDWLAAQGITVEDFAKIAIKQVQEYLAESGESIHDFDPTELYNDAVWSNGIDDVGFFACEDEWKECEGHTYKVPMVVTLNGLVDVEGCNIEEAYSNALSGDGFTISSLFDCSIAGSNIDGADDLDEIGTLEIGTLDYIKSFNYGNDNE